MPLNRIKLKIRHVDSTKNPIGKKKSILQPGIVIVSNYKLVTAYYCISSPVYFYYVVNNIFPEIILLLTLLSLVTGYFVSIQTKTNTWATYRIHLRNTLVIYSLSATASWLTTACPGKLLNNCKFPRQP
jgi:hypothetical protein